MGCLLVKIEETFFYKREKLKSGLTVRLKELSVDTLISDEDIFY